MLTDSISSVIGNVTKFYSAKETMMTYGGFRFCIATAAYEELTQISSYSWPEQPIAGSEPVLQFTGTEAETITLRGVIYPAASFVAWPKQQVPSLRTMAEKGIPYILVSGKGKNFGSWVIEKITEKSGPFFADGTPRKIEFDLNLKRYAKP
jgi:uncharacterized protein